MAEYIEREAAVKVAEKYGLANGSALGRHTGLADCIASEIADIPTADVAPVVHGRWEEADWVEPDCHGFVTIITPKAALRCSNCKNCFKKELLWKDNYCPNCGAKNGFGGRKMRLIDDLQLTSRVARCNYER